MPNPTVQIRLGVDGHAQVAAALNSIIGKAAALGLSFKAIKSATLDAINFAAGMGSAAKKAGLGVKEFSEIAEASHVETDKLVIAFRELSKQVVNNRALFKDLGIERLNQTGGLRDLSEIFLDLTEKFHNMGEGARATELAWRIFRRGSTEILPTLLKGREAMEKQIQTARDLGAVIDEPLAKASKTFKRNLDEIQLGLKGMALDIAREVLPALNDLTAALVNIMKIVRASRGGGDEPAFFSDMFRSLTALPDILTDIWKSFSGGYMGSNMGALQELREKLLRRFRGEKDDGSEIQEREHRQDIIELLTREQELKHKIAILDNDMAREALRTDTDQKTKRSDELFFLKDKLDNLKLLKKEIEKDRVEGGIGSPIGLNQGADGISAEAQAYDQKLLPVLRQIDEVQRQIHDNQLQDSFFGQMSEQYKSFTEEMAQLPQAFGEFAISPLKGLFDGMQEAIQGLIKGTMTWANAFKAVGSAILSSTITALAQLIAKAIILYGVVQLINVIAPGLGSALGVGAGAGARAAQGNVGFGTATGTAFAEGGYTGRSGGWVHGEEYVIPKQQVQQYGIPFFDSIRSGRYAGGGGGGGGVNIVAHLPVMTSQAQLDDYATKNEIDRVLWINNTYRHKFA